MTIKKEATAGTMESSDAMVVIAPAESGLSLSISSPVIHQYGNQIRKVVLDCLSSLGVENAEISVVDHGALDCTIKARVEGAVFRAVEASDADIPWGGAVR